MDPDLRKQMLAYYDQRAPEYEEAFTLGTGTTSIPNPEVFKTEAPVLGGIVRQFARGRIMDLACGTAVWLPDYAPNCSHITLFDQSDRMLLEARAKVHRLGLVDRCVFVRGDLFEHAFEAAAYDTALVGFLLSHLTEAQVHALFDALRTMLDASGRFLILDSAWSPERAMSNHKVEHQPRRLNDGTTFEIYKRYCDRDDIARWAADYGVELEVEHFGRAFYAVSGAFT
ncbi:MAG TPA: class I SAM-dependent methyltransferase [Vicinamibacterales bacterium]|nr:class I SAM-dependent methyltransferase [Vicinamibacterales bacterium]